MSKDDWLRRVQGLIAKAESTDSSAEAEALLAKAQELMATHAIDEAMLADRRGAATETVTQEWVTLDPPYATAKEILMAGIGRANAVRLIIHGTGKPRKWSLIGFPSDIEATKMLFASLSVHGAREMARAKVPPLEGARSFRHSFMTAFGARIGERMKEAAQAAAQQYEADTGTSTALVLASKDKAVDDKLQELYPRTRTVKRRAGSAAGYGAGTTAADRANLGEAVGGGSSRALGR